MARIKRLAENGWFSFIEKVAVMVIAAGLTFYGKLLFDLNTAVNVQAEQNKALVKSLEELKKDIAIVTDNLLNQPRFDKADARRMDDDHKEIMLDHEDRIRLLESRTWPE
jgi:hypothetical protein